MSNLTVANPFADLEPAIKTDNTLALATAEAEQRVLAEVQGRMSIAKRFPRNEFQACQAIIDACKRPQLASECLYAYPRGGQMITGPSIRLAEVMAQRWGNIDFGVRVLSATSMESIVETYAWDLESNVRKSTTFVVEHRVMTKKGWRDLSDPRDVYEHVANYAARRMRGCILQVIPRDVQDTAVEQVKATLANGGQSRAESLRAIVAAFDRFGVTVTDIERRYDRKLSQLADPEVVELRAIYQTLKDDIGERARFFSTGSANEAPASKLSHIELNKAKTTEDETPEAPAKVTKADEKKMLKAIAKFALEAGGVDDEAQADFNTYVANLETDEIVALHTQIGGASTAAGAGGEMSERAEIIYMLVDQARAA